MFYFTPYGPLNPHRLGIFYEFSTEADVYVRNEGAYFSEDCQPFCRRKGGGGVSCG